jgi:hypothetical protein
MLIPFLAGCWWLMSVIQTTKEAEIRRITVGSQPGKEFVRLYLKNIQHTKNCPVE